YPLWRCAVLKDLEGRGLSPFSGGFSEGETPLPIPNRAVKPLSADGTWLARAWESRTPPVFSSDGPPRGRPVVVLDARIPSAQRRELPRGLQARLLRRACAIVRLAGVRPGETPGGALVRAARMRGFMSHGGDAHVRPRRRLARPALAQTPAQRGPMRMTGRNSLVLVDLPVDFAVVLEQQERAGQ